MNPVDRHSALESLAYDLWVARGRPNGSPEIDWTEAERRLDEGGASTDTTIVRSSLRKSGGGSDGNFSEVFASGAQPESAADERRTAVSRVSSTTAKDSAADAGEKENSERARSAAPPQKNPRKR